MAQLKTWELVYDDPLDPNNLIPIPDVPSSEYQPPCQTSFLRMSPVRLRRRPASISSPGCHPRQIRVGPVMTSLTQVIQIAQADHLSTAHVSLCLKPRTPLAERHPVAIPAVKAKVGNTALKSVSVAWWKGARLTRCVPTCKTTRRAAIGSTDPPSSISCAVNSRKTWILTVSRWACADREGSCSKSG